MATRIVGLDIGTSAVRAVELTVGDGSRPVLEAFGQVGLHPGTVVDGEVRDRVRGRRGAAPSLAGGRVQREAGQPGGGRSAGHHPRGRHAADASRRTRRRGPLPGRPGHTLPTGAHGHLGQGDRPVHRCRGGAADPGPGGRRPPGHDRRGRRSRAGSRARASGHRPRHGGAGPGALRPQLLAAGPRRSSRSVPASPWWSSTRAASCSSSGRSTSAATASPSPSPVPWTCQSSTPKGSSASWASPASTTSGPSRPPLPPWTSWSARSITPSASSPRCPAASSRLGCWSPGGGPHRRLPPEAAARPRLPGAPGLPALARRHLAACRSAPRRAASIDPTLAVPVGLALPDPAGKPFNLLPGEVTRQVRRAAGPQRSLGRPGGGPRPLGGRDGVARAGREPRREPGGRSDTAVDHHQQRRDPQVRQGGLHPEERPVPRPPGRRPGVRRGGLARGVQPVRPVPAGHSRVLHSQHVGHNNAHTAVAYVGLVHDIVGRRVAPSAPARPASRCPTTQRSAGSATP